jgi:sulfatase modifying factor 1
MTPMTTTRLTWIRIEAGVCRYGDAGRPVAVSALWWTTTPVTYEHLGQRGRTPHAPVASMSQVQAARIAEQLGGRLPRAVEWEWMAAGPQKRRHPWGNQPWQPNLAQLAPCGEPSPAPVGSHPAGATPDGMLDVAGCVWEWTATPVMGCGYVIRGGSYASLPLYARCTFINAAPAELVSPGIGLRLVRPA